MAALPGDVPKFQISYGAHTNQAVVPLSSGTMIITPQLARTHLASGAYVDATPIRVDLAGGSAISPPIVASDAPGFNVDGDTLFTVSFENLFSVDKDPVYRPTLTNCFFPASGSPFDADLLASGETEAGVVITYPSTISVAGISGVVSAADLVTALDAPLSAKIGTYTQLPVLNIDTVGAAPIVDKLNYVQATFQLTGVDEGIIASGNLEIRGRGNYTWTLPKKPYRLKFANNIAPLGMSANVKNWALIPNHDDPSKINNALGMTLGQRSGLDWTPQYRYVEVVLNGVFLGLYQWMDLVRADTGRVPGPVATGTTGDPLTGTYLMEIDRRGIVEEAAPGFITAQGVYVAYDDPDGTTPEQATYISTWVQTFETALYSTSFLHPTNGYAKYIDMESFADWYIINELASNQDSNFYSSCKLWKSRDVGPTPGKLSMGPLWDLGLAFGLVINTPHPSTGFYTRPGAKWIERMFSDPVFVDLVRARWDLLVDQWFVDYPEIIDQTLGQIEDAARRDQTKWAYTSYSSQQSAFKKKWISERIAWLTAQFESPTDVVPSTVTTTV